MIETFPYGKAPFWLLVLSIASMLALVARPKPAAERQDLVFATFAQPHYEAYKKILPEFEREHDVKVSLELVNGTALQSRLQNAMLAGAEVPDMVELVGGTLGFFTSGPLKDVGFTDLTDRIERQGLRERLVASRFSLWSSRHRVFALPHDVHPVMLMYRADIVEGLGIDVSRIRTWDDFAAMGRKVTRDLDGDGTVDRYAIDLPEGGGFGLSVLLNQQDLSVFDANEQIGFDNPETASTIIWYLHQTRGRARISTECGWGQSLMKAISDGLALFYLAPDWRSYITQTDLPQLAGKMKLMPLPAWSAGGRRTSVWGGTGLAITKASQRQDLAWELANFLYLNKAALGERFAATNIIPPFKDAWNLPEFQKPNRFFSGQPLGAMYAELAPEAPATYETPYSALATSKLGEAYLRAAEYFDGHGDEGLAAYVKSELDRAAAYVSRVMNRNVFTRGGR
jgi:arabinosaccharide transport system substrate-binding protein